LAVVLFAKKKGVTDFSVTPWHASWWSWRESNPRPLECHASNILKLLNFGWETCVFQSIFLVPANWILAFCGGVANVLSTPVVAQPIGLR